MKCRNVIATLFSGQIESASHWGAQIHPLGVREVAGLLKLLSEEVHIVVLLSMDLVPNVSSLKKTGVRSTLVKVFTKGTVK